MRTKKDITPDLREISRTAVTAGPEVASKLADQLCKRYPKVAAAFAMAADMRLRLGKPKSALQRLKHARKLAPHDPQVKALMGRALRLTGKPEGALAPLREAHRALRNPMTAVELAAALRETGDFEDAKATLEDCLGLGDPAILFNLANLRRETGDPAGAAQLLEKLLQQSPSDPALLTNLGLSHLEAGNTEAALKHLRRGKELAPDDPLPHLNLARALLSTGCNAEAVEILDHLAAGKQTSLEHRHAAANLARDAQDLDRAESWLRACIAEQPHLPELWEDLIALLEEGNRLEDAMRELERAPKSPALNLLRAKVLRRRELYAEALAKLETMPQFEDPVLERRRQQEMMVCADSLGDADAAWAALQARPDRRIMAVADQERYARFLAWYEKGLPTFSSDSNPDDRSPVFLCGFPRSGTTLMDRFLRRHSQLYCTEEEAWLDRVAEGAMQADEPLDTDHRQRLRRHYLDMANVPERRILVDRMPVNFIHAPLIRLLWPKAPIVFMARHPVDVCLSCLMQDFRINPLTAHFESMEETVGFYIAAIKPWLRWRETAQHVTTVRYENLVADSRGTLTELLSILDLPWEKALESHDRETVSGTASYHQVGRELYTSAVDRWRRYRQYLEPWIDDLAPLAAELGYAMD